MKQIGRLSVNILEAFVQINTHTVEVAAIHMKHQIIFIHSPAISEFTHIGLAKWWLDGITKEGRRGLGFREQFSHSDSEVRCAGREAAEH